METARQTLPGSRPGQQRIQPKRTAGAMALRPGNAGTTKTGDSQVERLDHNQDANGARLSLVSAPGTVLVPPVSRHGSGNPELYLNRELSWLKFNRRVLNEAGDRRIPLLERVKFLAIANANLDEFYMKRIGGLKQQIGAGVTGKTVDGRTPIQQISACAAEMKTFQTKMKEIYDQLIVDLAKAGIGVEKYSDLSGPDREVLSLYFREKILPLMTPLAIDWTQRLPFISNLSLNLLVALNPASSNQPRLARIKIPDAEHVPHFIDVGDSGRFVMIQDVITNNLDVLFPGLQVRSCGLFRITRNAITEKDPNGANDLLEMIASELRNRKFAPVVRLQTTSGVDNGTRAMLAGKLGLSEAEDLVVTDDMAGMSALMQLAKLDRPDLRDKPHHPVDNRALDTGENIFASIRAQGSVLLQHPYESFATSVKRFVREASTDPKVLAIKMTLYRTSADTKIIEYLINAVQNGKQVAVVVELQARFDEAANIEWAARLVEAGIHVNYGVFGLKTHCKTILVVRREDGGLRRYAHFGTGNYHAGTARLYSDIGLLTCDETLADDLTELFNHLTTRWSTKPDHAEILTAPLTIKKAILAKIDREIAVHSESSPGLIRLKTNALEDVDITNALYRASQAGVKVELLIRDICRLRPGVPGLSENVTVISIIGRFLEHSRIYYFRNGGDEEFYIGSADLMRRNLERRVEVIVPVKDAPARRLLHQVLERQLRDRRNAWVMDAEGNYSQRRPAPGNPRTGCQEAAIRAAGKRGPRHRNRIAVRARQQNSGV